MRECGASAGLQKPVVDMSGWMSLPRTSVRAVGIIGREPPLQFGVDAREDLVYWDQGLACRMPAKAKLLGVDHIPGTCIVVFCFLCRYLDISKVASEVRCPTFNPIRCWIKLVPQS